MAHQKTYNVYASKTGVLHVADRNQRYAGTQTVTTWGTWKNGRVMGPLRTLRMGSLTPAGVLIRDEVDGHFRYEYRTDAAHV